MNNFTFGEIKSGLTAILFISLSLVTWSLAIEITDFAPVFLFPLSVVIYCSVYRLHMNVWKAHYELIVRSDSAIYNLLNGKIRGHLNAFIFTLVSVTVLAWFFITAPLSLVAALCLIIAIFCSMLFIFKNSLRQHFNEPFATKYAVNLATILGAGVSFFVLWWHAWAIDLHDAEFQSVDLIGAIEIGKSQIPNPSSIFAHLLMFPFVFDAVKLWAVVQLKTYSNMALILSLEAALVGFLIAKMSIIVTNLVDEILERLSK